MELEKLLIKEIFNKGDKIKVGYFIYLGWKYSCIVNIYTGNWPNDREIHIKYNRYRLLDTIREGQGEGVMGGYDPSFLEHLFNELKEGNFIYV